MNSKALLMRRLAIFAIVSLIFLAGCGGSTSQLSPNLPPPPASVTVSPSSATVQPGGVQQFTAAVSPKEASQAVTWSVSGTGCTGASCGTIDGTGKYTAPATVPNPATGNGNISAGTEDISSLLIFGVITNEAFTGKYSICSDNRGSMTLTSSHGVTFNFSLAVGSFESGVAQRGRLVDLDDFPLASLGSSPSKTQRPSRPRQSAGAMPSASLVLGPAASWLPMADSPRAAAPSVSAKLT